MEKIFKFENEQTIFYLNENRVHSAKVLSRMKIDIPSEREKASYTKEQKEFNMPFGPSRECYITCHGIVEAKSAFASKEELVASL